MGILSWVALSLLLAAFLGVLLFRLVFVPWGTRWGATAEECRARMAGDAFMAESGHGRASIVMTRAISIAAPPSIVSPWLGQLGRGAGFYSYDRLDNGGKRSANHIVSWIPAPALGDSSAIGYLRHLEPGAELAWWAPAESFLGAEGWMATDMRVAAEGKGSRLVIRISGDVMGRTAWLAKRAFMVIDCLMARRQLLEIRQRAERYAERSENRERPETGARDQYQLYEVVFASGDRAGVAGKEHGARFRELAARDLA